MKYPKPKYSMSLSQSYQTHSESNTTATTLSDTKGKYLENWGAIMMDCDTQPNLQAKIELNISQPFVVFSKTPFRTKWC